MNPNFFSSRIAHILGTAKRATTTSLARWTGPAVVAGALLFIAAPAVAQYQTTSVVYSFTRQTIAGQTQYLLVPVATDQIRPELPIRQTVPIAFDLLRGAKAATYAGTTLRLTDSDITAGQAVVTIDPSVAEYFPIIAAECVYTFSQLGIDTVLFPGFDDDGMTRADVPYGGFRAQVPMWQAVPPAEVFESDIILPDGSLIDSEAFYDAINNDAALQQQVLTYLSSPWPFEVFGALAAIETLEIDGAQSQMIPLLQSPEASLREATLQALMTSDDDAVWDEIVNVMRADPEARIRAIAAEALATSDDDAYRFYEIVYRAESGPNEQRFAAIEELGGLGDERVDEVLASMLAGDDVVFATSALRALVARDAWDRIEPSLESETLGGEIRIEIAAAMAASDNDERRLTGIRYQVFALQGERALGMTNAIAEDGSDAALIVLESLLAHPDLLVQLRAAERLGERGETSSLEALSDAAGNSENTTLQRAIEDAAVAILVTQSIGAVEEAATDRSAVVQRAAYRAMGHLAQDGGGDQLFDALTEGIASTDANIRGACALALSNFESQAALDVIVTLQGDDSAGVRADVARSLGGFAGEDFAAQVNPIVAGFVEDGDPAIMAGALDAIGRLGNEQFLPLVLQRIDHADGGVRAAAMRSAVALTQLDRPRATINAVSGRLRDEMPSNQLLAAQLLGTFDHEIAVLALSQIVTDPNVELRLAAVTALGSTGNREAASIVVRALDDSSRAVQLAAVASLQTLGYQYIVPDIERAMNDTADPDVVAAEQALIEFLNTSGQ